MKKAVDTEMYFVGLSHSITSHKSSSKLLVPGQKNCIYPSLSTGRDDDDDDEDDDGSDDTSFHFFFFDIRTISLAFQPVLETKRSPGILLNLQLGWNYLDIKPSGLINYQALSLSELKTAIGAPSHMI